MANQLRLFVGASVTGVFGWSAYTAVARHDTLGPMLGVTGPYPVPPPSRRRFTPGSADDAVAEALRSGDVLLFGRNCLLMQPCGAGVCALSKLQRGQRRFDHCGVVVVRFGVPFVLEETLSGPRLRPYEQRVLRSQAHDITVRRLVPPLTAEQARRLSDFADQATGGGGKARVAASDDLTNGSGSGGIPRGPGVASQLVGLLQTTIANVQWPWSSAASPRSRRPLHVVPSPPAVFVARALDAAGVLPAAQPPEAFTVAALDGAPVAAAAETEAGGSALPGGTRVLSSQRLALGSPVVVRAR